MQSAYAKNELKLSFDSDSHHWLGIRRLLFKEKYESIFFVAFV